MSPMRRMEVALTTCIRRYVKQMGQRPHGPSRAKFVSPISVTDHFLCFTRVAPSLGPESQVPTLNLKGRSKTCTRKTEAKVPGQGRETVLRGTEMASALQESHLCVESKLCILNTETQEHPKVGDSGLPYVVLHMCSSFFVYICAPSKTTLCFEVIYTAPFPSSTVPLNLFFRLSGLHC